MKKEFKKIILIDLDGVLNTYEGNFDKDFIPPIKEGAKEFLKNLSETFDIKIFTTRNKILASKWICENELEDYIKDVTDHKDLCWLFIDDRCINFQGNYEDLTTQIQNFKAWYKN
ncbi:hypothetical protein IJ707_05550 [bacterium]|nr:hypothetical protein [bacterium]